MSFGEVGLTGELRAVSNPGQRINEGIPPWFPHLHHACAGCGRDLLQKMNIVRAKTVGDDSCHIVSIFFTSSHQTKLSLRQEGILHLENKIRAVLLTTAAVLPGNVLFWSWKHRPPRHFCTYTAAAGLQDILQ